MAELEMAASSTGIRESDKAGGATVGEGPRKSLEDRLAEFEAQTKRVRKQMRVRDKQARAQFEKDLWGVLKAEKFDNVSIEVWRKAAPTIGAALTAATQ